MKINVIEGGQLTEHFKLSEFYCNDSAQMYVDEFFFYTFLPTLEQFRVWYNRPININSGYRSAACNKRAGGSSNSAHLKARAVDFNYPAEYFTFSAERKEQFLQNVKKKWTILCHKQGVYAQVNFYNNRFHLGMSEKADSFLDYRK